MLGMIEINLLPQEYRVQERTPLGLLLTVVVGFLVVGGIVIYWLDLKNQLNTAVDKNATLQKTKDAAQAEVDKCDAARSEIDNAKKRQDAIIALSQSKILWSQKLVQFGKILGDFPDFWIDRLSLERGGKSGNGVLSCTFFALGQDLSRLAYFRNKIKSDTNFWYHFDTFEASHDSRIKGGGPLAGLGYKGAIMQMSTTMPCR